jgi:hypothetical protein
MSRAIALAVPLVAACLLTSDSSLDDTKQRYWLAGCAHEEPSRDAPD